jgi:ribosomal protein S18 acetylase RimI-like enzyme
MDMTPDLSPLQIRRVKQSDLPALEWEGQFTHFRKVYQHAFEEAQRGDRVLLVAESDGKLIGQIFIHLNPRNLGTNVSVPTAYLHSFRVRSAYRNVGVGSKLLSHAEEVMRQMGIQLAVIAVSKSNPRALGFYQKWGFSVFREDAGRWSYLDHLGRLRDVHDPSYLLQKALNSGSPDGLDS